MATYIGFSTVDINQQLQFSTAETAGPRGKKNGKKFKLTDNNLIVRDFINALSIKQGDKVGQPGYGTIIWDFVFEPNTDDITTLVENEIKRVAGNDPRIDLTAVTAYSYENGILIELQAMMRVTGSYLEFGLLIDKQTGTVQSVTA
jgi:phage baseplate assembly protein W